MTDEARSDPIFAEYAAALARTLGADAARGRVEEVAARADEMRGHGRRLFGRWLELAQHPIAA